MTDIAQNPAKPAATVVLLRDDPSGYEIFMAERAKTMAFAGGMMVFPGGKVDAADAALAADPALAPGFARLDPIDAAARVAAVRETFEEAGVLLSRGPSVPEAVRSAWRPRIVRHDVPFAAFLAAVGHVLDPARLIPFAHWCPPADLEARRYDTRFYLAVMPKEETAVHDGDESVTSHWIRPAEALARADAGETTIIFPTRRNLERIAQWPTIEALIAHACETPLRLVQPWMEMRDGQPWLHIPTGIGYPVTAEPLTSVRRS